MTGLTVYLLHSLERTGMVLKRHAAAIAPATILFEGLAERPAITKHIFPLREINYVQFFEVNALSDDCRTSGGHFGGCIGEYNNIIYPRQRRHGIRDYIPECFGNDSAYAFRHDYENIHK